MNTHWFPGKKLILIVAATAVFLAQPASRAGANFEYADTAKLTVWRAADFGTVIYLNLFIDGQKVTTLARGQGYQALVHSGRHSITFTTSPNPYGQTRVFRRDVSLGRGQEHSYTAIWEHDVVRLENGTPELYRYGW